MKAIVTGAAGFIGSHLCERLLADGLDVVGVDNFDEFYDPKIKRSNIRTCLSNSRFRLVEEDIRDAEKMDEITSEDADIIVHLAAKAGVRPSIAQPALYADVNISGTMTLLEAAKKNHISKFVFASSSSVYGNNKKVPFSEDDNVDFPISPYAATKKAGELICHTYYHLYGIPVTCLRFFTVYGPRQRPDLAIHKFARLIERGKPIPVYGDGSMMRDFTYIDDIVQGVLAALTTSGLEPYEIINLGNHRCEDLSRVIALLERELNVKAQQDLLPMQPGDVPASFADINRARQKLGFEPTTPIDQGVPRFVKWYRDYHGLA